MRDINRLDNFYDTLRLMHKHYFPDWRFGQMLINFQRWYAAYNNDADIFYLEEDMFLKAFREYIDWSGIKYA